MSHAPTTRWRRLVVVIAVIVAAGGAFTSAGTVLAHAELVSTNPANGSILASEPSEIVLRFSEDVDIVGEAIRMVDAEGTPRPLGVIDQSLGKDTIRADVPAQVLPGTYVVGWQAVSADSHKVRGAFTFSVGVETRPEPGVTDSVFDEGSTSTSDSLLLGLGRFLSYAGIGVLVGTLFMAAVLVPELIGQRRLGAVLVAAALAGVFGTVFMFAGQSHLITGSYFGLSDVVGIESGRWWLARLAVIGLLALFIPARSFLTSTVGRIELAAAGLVAFGVVAAGGHAVAGDDVALGFGATIVHLAAMSIWTGGLVLLVAGIPRSWFWWTASKFSPWALGSVVALAVTGAANAWRQLGSFADLSDSSYGRWLIVKLVLVGLVVGAAAVSRRLARSDDPDDEVVEQPAEERVLASVGSSVADHEGAPFDGTAFGGAVVPAPQEPPAALRRSVMFEVVGIALILGATAGLVNSPPPPSAATVESASAVVGDRIAQVELEPAVTGGAEMHVYISSPNGGLDRPDEITVEASLPAADLGPLEFETVPAGPGHVVADVDLPVAGTWQFDVTARYGEFDQVVFTVDLPVSD